MNIVSELKINNLQNFARQNFIPVVQESTCNFLFDTVKNLQPKRMLEIGTAIGYSGIVLLNASKSATLTTVELNADRAKMATQNFNEFNVSNRVNLIVNDAMKELENLQNQEFDFVFLDGPKGQYTAYLPLILNILTVGGIIFCDNIEFNHMVNSDKVAPRKVRTIVNNLKKFKTEITNNANLKTTFYNVGDGVAIIEKLK